MKKLYALACLLAVTVASAQDGSPAMPYYSGFDFSQTGMTLKNALAAKTIAKHTKNLTYAQAENALKIVDLDPDDSSNNNLLLLYGFSSNMCPASATDDKDHRRRDKGSDDDGTAAPCMWNREHTFPKALGSPDLGTTGPGADAHHLRACDKKRNADRDNDKFYNSTGDSHESGSFWYPGDEWKGDVARMVMYMYLRYGSQCLPTNVGVGSLVLSDPNMVDIFLQWNADDPVSQYEDNRNTYLGQASNAYGQGNRNPFIDNPYLATVIWGGPVAQNRWPGLGTADFSWTASLSVYPNPANGHRINISSEVSLDAIELITINGQRVYELKKPTAQNNTYTLENLPEGFYFLKLTSENQQSVTKKIIVN